LPGQRGTPSAVAAPARRATGERLFDGGDTLLDDDIMRANWAVPWSDLMMTMFVLFAALLALQTLHARAQPARRNHHHAGRWVRCSCAIPRRQVRSVSFGNNFCRCSAASCHFGMNPASFMQAS
jgi:hypothetical protein